MSRRITTPPEKIYLSVLHIDNFDLDKKPTNEHSEEYVRADLINLTPEDISLIKVLLDDVEYEFRSGLHNDEDYNDYCKEVLRRFKETKEK